MSSFREAMGKGGFVVTAQVDPPAGGLTEFLQIAGGLAARVSALVVSDNRGVAAAVCPVTAAARLVEKGGAEVVVTLSCRDKNRLALAQAMLAARAWGLDNLLLVSGDHPATGLTQSAKPVYDLDSVQAMQMAAEMANGKGPAGEDLPEPVEFFVGGAAPLAASPLEPALLKLAKKARAGAGFFLGQAVTSLEQLQQFRQSPAGGGVKLLAGLDPGDFADAAAAAELFRQIKASGLADGVHIYQPASLAELPALLDAMEV